jgi:hypothetical protein
MGLTGVYLVGEKRRVGWVLGIGVQFLWITYALVTRQWGFIVTAVAFAVIYGRNWSAWKKADDDAADPA